MQGKAYVYVRSCSGDDKKIERQKKKCKIFIEKYIEGFKLVKVFADRKASRKGLAQLHQVVKPGDYIVITSLDVIARDDSTLVEILKHFHKKIKIIIANPETRAELEDER